MGRSSVDALAVQCFIALIVGTTVDVSIPYMD